MEHWPLIVADSAEGPVGFARLHPFRPGEGYAGTAEHTVYVSGAARGRGLGGMLLDGMVEEAGARGFRRLVGAISADQPASLGLHRSRGFVESGRLSGVGRKFGRNLDLVLMLRELDKA